MKEPWPIISPRSLVLLAVIGTICYLAVVKEGEEFTAVLSILTMALGFILGYFFPRNDKEND